MVPAQFEVEALGRGRVGDHQSTMVLRLRSNDPRIGLQNGASTCSDCDSRSAISVKSTRNPIGMIHPCKSLKGRKRDQCAVADFPEGQLFAS